MSVLHGDDSSTEPGASPRPLWLTVILLALPVLAQQLLLFFVGISDRYLAGHIDIETTEQQVEMLGKRVLAVGALGGTADTGLGGVLSAEAAWELARDGSARPVAYQAAQTTATYIAWFVTCYIVLVSVGSTALVARFVGAGERAMAIHATNQALVLGITLGALGSLAGWAVLEALIHVLHLRGEAAQLACAYLRPMFLLVGFQVVEMAGIACLVGAGDTMTGFLVTAGVAFVNLPLAWGLSLGLGPLPHLGFAGISLGAALSHCLGCIVILVLLGRGRAGLKLSMPLMVPNPSLLWRLLRISVPAGADSLSQVAGQLWFLSIVNGLGNVAGGAHGIALGWEAIGFLSGSAFGTAAMSLVGRNLRVRRPDLAARSAWIAFRIGGGWMCFMGAIFFWFAPEMFALFCPYPHQRPIIETGVPVLRLVAFAMPALACTIIFTGSLRGAGDTRVPMLVTWVGFLVVRIPLAYYLTAKDLHLGPLGTWSGCDLGLFGAWLAMFADLNVRGGLMLLRFVSGRWKSIRV